MRLLDTRSWPSAEQLDLDNSQLEAVKMALTKEFAVIQGPPGTGKTYIGLKVHLFYFGLWLLLLHRKLPKSNENGKYFISFRHTDLDLNDV